MKKIPIKEYDANNMPIIRYEGAVYEISEGHHLALQCITDKNITRFVIPEFIYMKDKILVKARVNIIQIDPELFINKNPGINNVRELVIPKTISMVCNIENLYPLKLTILGNRTKPLEFLFESLRNANIADITFEDGARIFNEVDVFVNKIPNVRMILKMIAAGYDPYEGSMSDLATWSRPVPLAALGLYAKQEIIHKIFAVKDFQLAIEILRALVEL